VNGGVGRQSIGPNGGAISQESLIGPGFHMALSRALPGSANVAAGDRQANAITVIETKKGLQELIL